jgi:hypothetical protein
LVAAGGMAAQAFRGHLTPVDVLAFEGDAAR